jgi:hypothetical protein
MPQYWASLARVSREKAPALAQPFGRRKRSRDSRLLERQRLRIVARRSALRRKRRTCCRFVTVQTIRNGLVSADAKLSSFVAAGIFAVRAIASPAPDRRRKPMEIGINGKSGSTACLPAIRRRDGFAAEVADAPIVLDETCSKPWGKLRLLTSFERARVASKGLDHSIVNLGVLGCLLFAEHWQQRRCHSPRSRRPASPAPPTAGQGQGEAAADLPFFLVIDDRVTFSYMPKGTDPGMFTVNPNGTINGKTAKQVYSFTHFDAWAYGTNFFTISMFKSDHNDPASPCTNAGREHRAAGDCAGATEIYGLFRSTFGWNESSTPRPSPWGRCTTSRSKSAWTPTPRTTSWRRQA